MKDNNIQLYVRYVAIFSLNEIINISIPLSAVILGGFSRAQKLLPREGAVGKNIRD